MLYILLHIPFVDGWYIFDLLVRDDNVRYKPMCRYYQYINARIKCKTRKKKNDECSMQRASSLLNTGTLSIAMKLLNFCADNIIISQRNPE